MFISLLVFNVEEAIWIWNIIGRWGDLSLVDSCGASRLQNDQPAFYKGPVVPEGLDAEVESATHFDISSHRFDIDDSLANQVTITVQSK